MEKWTLSLHTFALAIMLYQVSGQANSEGDGTEVYTHVQLSAVNGATDQSDVVAIYSIMSTYFGPTNWIDDPCFPEDKTWHGVECEYQNDNTTARIVYLNLSHSYLFGPIATSFSGLGSIKTLDLSYNSLTGEVPEFLTNTSITSLTSLNLTQNCLTPPVPVEPSQVANDGKLTLRFYPQKGCLAPNNSKKKIKNIIIIGAVASAIAVTMIAGLIICIRKRRQTAMVTHGPPQRTSGSRALELSGINQTTKFTRSQLEKIIKNFNKRIGGGGFGDVFYGKLENNIEVAIKVLSDASSQGYKEFKKEVEALSSVYHANIVAFIGYCEEGEYLALVYEFVLNGSLADHLHAGPNIPSVLNWRTKLKIAHGAAQGLEYLHTGCNMVHRDVKSANILLDHNFESKVSDFGMSRIFNSNTITMTQTAVCGTIGYLDPEILTGFTQNLSFPSDVYSFGVVLLEIVTGKPPYSQERGSAHIVDYVSQNPQNPAIIDIKIGEFDPDAMMMLINLAMKCTQRNSIDRPTMSHVVIELQQCLDVGMSLQWNMSQYTTGFSSTTSKTILSQRLNPSEDENISFTKTF